MSRAEDLGTPRPHLWLGRAAPAAPGRFGGGLEAAALTAEFPLRPSTPAVAGDQEPGSARHGSGFSRASGRKRKMRLPLGRGLAR